MKPDGKSIPLNIVSFFFPLVGLVVYLVLRDLAPIRARSLGKWSAAGAGVYGVLIAAYVIVVYTFMSTVMVPMENSLGLTEPTSPISVKAPKTTGAHLHKGESHKAKEKAPSS
jgi:hypothetical protein